MQIILPEDVFIIVHKAHMLIVLQGCVYRHVHKDGMELMVHEDVKEYAQVNNLQILY